MRIESMALHYVGNQANEEPFVCSKKLFTLSEDMNTLLTEYFVGSFKSEERFVFHDDGTYNGMVRKGTFLSTDKDGDIILEGNYQCDNYNLRLDFSSEDGGKHKILAQVLSFTDDTVVIQYLSLFLLLYIVCVEYAVVGNLTVG